mgnify:CR=1 FL=1
MNGTISRLVDNAQSGTIAGEDGREYFFSASAVRDVTFSSLALGVRVSFTAVETLKGWRAETVRLQR